MKRVILPSPPNPDDQQFRNHPLAYNRAIHQWAHDTKGKLEEASEVNSAPLARSFVVTSGYTITTTIASTSTGTDITNFLCTLVAAMTTKGLVKPN